MRFTAQLFIHAGSMAAIAQLGERETEDLEVLGSIPGFGIFYNRVSFSGKSYILYFRIKDANEAP